MKIAKIAKIAMVAIFPKNVLVNNEIVYVV